MELRLGLGEAWRLMWNSISVGLNVAVAEHQEPDFGQQTHGRVFECRCRRSVYISLGCYIQTGRSFVILFLDQRDEMKWVVVWTLV